MRSRIAKTASPYTCPVCDHVNDVQERLRAKARHDEAQALHSTEQNSQIEIARKLPKRNRPIDEIMEDTGLAKEIIENLKI